MQRSMFLFFVPLLVFGCSSDDAYRQELADSIQRIADVVVEEIRGPTQPVQEDEIKAALDTIIASSTIIIDGTFETSIGGIGIPCNGDDAPTCPIFTSMPASLSLSDLIDAPVEQMVVDHGNMSPTLLFPDLQYEALPSENQDLNLGWAGVQDTKPNGEAYSFRSLAGWMEHSMFLVNVYDDDGEYIISDGRPYPVSNDGSRTLDGYFVEFFSLGNATSTMPTSTALTWSGTMLGIIEGITDVRGDADVSLNLDIVSTDGVKVEFSNIVDIKTGRGALISAVTWPHVPFSTDGRFEKRGTDESVGIAGQFYGPNHEEVGGVFSISQMRGAFGATATGPLPCLSCQYP